MKTSSFLLIKTNTNSINLLSDILKSDCVLWAKSVYGPHQIVAYLESDTETQIVEAIENMRGKKGINEIDARRVKVIPGDEDLKAFKLVKPINAVLLINVNYKEEKERVVTWSLRTIPGIVFARAMWGPADIIAVVEAEDHESMRNLICDKVKTQKGVRENSTLYCFP
jgi:DNA-binding Lrp family transcriptional regulator